MKKKLSVFLATVVTCVMIFGSSLSVLGAATTDAKTGDVNIASMAEVSTDASPFAGWDGDITKGGDIKALTDGENNEWYAAGDTEMPFHLDFQYKDEASISGVTLTTVNLADYMVSSIRFQYLDGDQWVDITTETYEKDEALGEWDTYQKHTDFGKTVKTNTLRLEITGKAAWGAACRIGEIEIWGQYDGEAPDPSQPVTPDNSLANLAPKAEAELINAEATTGEGVEAVNDGNATSYFSLTAEAAGGDVKEITYDTQPEILIRYPVTAEFSQLEWNAHVDWDGASVLAFEVSYYDEKTDSYLPVTHSGGAQVYTPSLVGKKLFQFDQAFETDKIKITLLKSRASWDKSGMIGEIKTLGKWTGDMPPETVEKKTTDKKLATDVWTEDDINLLTDGEKDQLWTGKIYPDKYMQLHAYDLETIDGITFYSDEPQEDLGKIRIQTSTTSSKTFGDACEAAVGAWVKDGDGYKAELDLKEESLAGRSIRLIFSEKHEVAFTEIELNGTAYKGTENVLRGIALSNGSDIDEDDCVTLTDNNTWTTVTLDAAQPVKADFSGYQAEINNVVYFYQDDNGICRYERVKPEASEASDWYELPLPESWTGEKNVSEIYVSGTRTGGTAGDDEQTENEITKLENNEINIKFAEDKHSFIQNPATGWVLYIEDCYADPYAADGVKITQGMTTEQYWANIDQLMDRGLQPSILYIRLGWSWFEPSEGNYAWNDPDSDIYKLIQGAKERNLQLAFRVLIDSTDNSQQAIPEWVFEKGLPVDSYTTAWNLEDDSEISVKEGKCDDPVFLENFEAFLKAFGERFDTDSSVAYIDAQGMGNWGEVNGICASDKDQAVNRIMGLYQKYFKHVLLGFQMYSEAGTDYGKENGFIMRRDGLGSPVWYSDDQKQGIVDEFLKNKNILYGESCYHGLEHGTGDGGRWSTTNNIVGWSTQQILTYLMDDALTSRANTLDFRMYSDALCWLEDYPEGIQRFIEEGGYRFSPVEVTMPTQAEAGQTIEISHTWKNAGVGRLPNNNPQWNGKYMLTLALLDENNEVVTQADVKDADLSDWIRESDHSYETGLQIPEDLKNGTYHLAVSILNQTEVGASSINLALADTEKSGDWYLLGDISVGTDDTTPDDGNKDNNPDNGNDNNNNNGGNNNADNNGNNGDGNGTAGDIQNPDNSGTGANGSGTVNGGNTSNGNNASGTGNAQNPNTSVGTAVKTGDVKTVWWYVFLFGAASVVVVMNVRRKNCKK